MGQRWRPGSFERCELYSSRQWLWKRAKIDYMVYMHCLSCFLHRTDQKEPARGQKLGFVFGRHNNTNHLHTTTTPIFYLKRNAF